MADLTDVRGWAAELIATHLDDSWSFAFDNAKTRAGKCNFERREISVSRYLAQKHSDEQVKQTLLHEIAHGMVGARAGHGPVWQACAAQIGYVGGRTHTAEVADEFAKWVGTCPNGHEIYRFRRPGNRAVSCAKCSKRFDRRFLVTWRERQTV
ncbi:SprT-like domain-containing protein [Gulosibacter molinativorax]|uniref:SprT domain-containing protein n=1 Tax=Gulosibacter molinativorax TaxID=256821 RepID=A0ABT7C7Y6_9MICO|nr:SprT-like domain-containing protein [Gulosibacter molinativorax]MDJ1371304.1 sprT domain-containing protein [Gulosibacter molinativorax]QUY63632.1 Predicted metal-dependent hydrolase [Gulosibacter molinativorax]